MKSLPLSFRRRRQGQGVLVKTPTECKKLGGTLTEPK